MVVNDLISRQAAIELIESEYRRWGEEYGISDVLCDLDDMPTAEPKWTPCSERLPDITNHHTSEPCLVYCDNGTYTFAELEENIFGQVGWNCERDDDYHEAVGVVTAWMPLPKPYEEESDES